MRVDAVAIDLMIVDLVAIDLMRVDLVAIKINLCESYDQTQ